MVRRGDGRKSAGERAHRRAHFGARPERRRLGYAVVGLGHIAQAAVLPAFSNASRNSKLVALVSGAEEKRRRLGRLYRVPSYDYERFEDCLAQPEVDAVYISLPNTRHRDFALRAARAGVHVLCEKPMATSSQECREMIRACEESEVKLMVAYRLHFDEPNLRAAELARKGRLGELGHLISYFSYQVRPPNIRLRRELGGGPLWDIGIYCLNAARQLFSAEPIEVQAFAAKGREPRFAEVEEALSAILRFPGERLASFVCSFGTEASAWYQLSGADGWLFLDRAYNYQGERTLELMSRGRTRRLTFPGRDQFAPELSYFSDCVLRDREPEPDGYEGLADVRVIEALYDSARIGRPVKLEPMERKRGPSRAQAYRVPPVREPELIHVSPPS
ncbi:MAG: Gfo/Idh/MocA family oxidoreductase [Myxococcales bacterium]|nr:Gfo/Idh/MocA family oxidoreductase [Myxococcales bacterium]